MDKLLEQKIRDLEIRELLDQIEDDVEEAIDSFRGILNLVDRIRLKVGD